MRVPVHRYPTPLCLLFLHGLSLAQPQTIVSPAPAATTEGASGNFWPWEDATPRRYMQIHSDLGLTAKSITKIAFRKDGGGSPVNSTRQVDFEMFMGSSVAWDRASFVFASNFIITTKTQVYARRTTTIGPLTGTGSPAPFEVGFMLDQPYVHIGVFSLAWDMNLYGNAGSLTLIDADVGTTVSVTPTYVGTGCVASGQTLSMTQTLRGSDIGGTFSVGPFVVNAPSNAPSVLALGFINPSLSVPGLCGQIHTDLVVAVPIGTTDATGFLGEFQVSGRYPGGRSVFVLPNTFPGATFTTQVHSLDPGSSMPIQVANSNGGSVTVPVSNPAKLCQVTRLVSHNAGVNATNSIYYNTSTVGYALVTQFTY